jgi:hypothetical protein
MFKQTSADLTEIPENFILPRFSIELLTSASSLIFESEIKRVASVVLTGAVILFIG